jgi:hypothetical protein
MSSHREAPAISIDPVADSTDLYAFVSPDNPETVTLIANYVPLQAPAGGPNFYEFGDDVLYSINIDNNGDGQADISFLFRFQSQLADPNTFLYNVGPIESLGSANWNRRQFYSVSRVDWNNGRETVIGQDLPCPPCNIGPLSTPNYATLATQAVQKLPGGMTVFAGQRAEGFYVDLGSIFDLGDLRPFQDLHTQFGLSVPELQKPAPGVNATKGVNVDSIVLQVPKASLTADGSNPTDPSSPSSVIGVYTSASRQRVLVQDGAGAGQDTWAGPFMQVSRLGNPLFNEVLVPLGMKDYWNTQVPAGDSQFAQYVQMPELAKLLNVLYPGIFSNLASYAKPRGDLVAILLTGIPSGVVAGFQNSAGTTQADLLRLNMAIPPTTNGASNLGLIGMDPAGFPNGRRVFDDVVTIELRAIAGATIPLVDSSFTPDAAAGGVTDGLTSGPTDLTAMGTENYLATFPYLGIPYDGYDFPSS